MDNRPLRIENSGGNDAHGADCTLPAWQPSGSGSGATTASGPAGRRIRTAVANALRRFAPVETGRLRRSIRVVSYGVLIGVRYASFTNERGRSAGWVERAIASVRSAARFPVTAAPTQPVYVPRPAARGPAARARARGRRLRRRRNRAG